MVKLLIIADDFTGALDTGVQFAARGAKTRVVADANYDLAKAEADVLVLDAETRHLPPEEAYKLVYRVASAAKEAGIPHIYKKTDSGLRGNIGCELSAVMDALKAESLPFIPAFPSMNRVTRDGVQLIDGVPVADYTISSLRGKIGIVTQEPIIFNDTIANNIAYSRPGASPEEIRRAAERANAHDFIVSGTHPLGYDEEAGERGCKLSGGEKQRIVLARIILKNPPILVLDEATSALDTVTEKLIQDALNRVMENRTVFAIAHRLSTIRNADLILVMDKGRIVERGTHDELLALNGRYRKLHDTQFSMDRDI